MQAQPGGRSKALSTAVDGRHSQGTSEQLPSWRIALQNLVVGSATPGLVLRVVLAHRPRGWDDCPREEVMAQFPVGALYPDPAVLRSLIGWSLASLIWSSPDTSLLSPAIFQGHPSWDLGALAQCSATRCKGNFSSRLGLPRAQHRWPRAVSPGHCLPLLRVPCGYELGVLHPPHSSCPHRLRGMICGCAAPTQALATPGTNSPEGQGGTTGSSENILGFGAVVPLTHSFSSEVSCSLKI